MYIIVFIFFSFSDIQGAISKINPEIIKSVIASGSAKSSISLPSTPKEEPITFPDVPLYRHIPKYLNIINLYFVKIKEY